MGETTSNQEPISVIYPQFHHCKCIGFVDINFGPAVFSMIVAEHTKNSDDVRFTFAIETTFSVFPVAKSCIV